jgi:cytochrome c oxidase subunit I+III
MMSEGARQALLLARLRRLPDRLLPDAPARHPRHAAAGLHLSRRARLGDLNLVATIGAFIFALSLAIFVGNALASLRRGREAGPNPWGASGLEWAAASPPASYNFPHIPVVSGRNPLWEEGETLPVAYGLRVDDRELLLTTVIDAARPARALARAEHLAAHRRPRHDRMFVSSIFTPWAVPIGSIPVAAALIAWFWPKDSRVTPEPVID